jgi:arylesterase/paraoxonase
MRSVIASGLIVGMALGGFRVFGTLQAGGVFREAGTNYDMTCSSVPGVPGPEDLVVDRSSGIVFVSSHDRRADLAAGDEDNTVRGAIFAFDPARPALGFVELTGVVDYGPGPADFRPHGLSLYTGPDGARTLMVINHPHGEESTVEIYDVVDPLDPVALPSLRYRVTVSSPSLVTPNDLVAIDSVRFYVTNDHGFTNPVLRVFEDYLRLNVGSVVYFDGEMFSRALGGLTFANGIEVSADGKTLYVAETTDTRIGAYGIEPDSGSLSLLRTWDLGFGVDNIDRDADGSLWIGGHPKMLDFIAHAADPDVPSAGKVVRIDPESEAAPVVVFEEKGALISGLSVAAWHDGKVFMGKVFDDGLLICEKA